MTFLDSILAAFRTKPVAGKRLGRHKVRDIAITYRVGAGVPGTISRINPTPTIEPTLIDAANPPTVFGQPVIIDATSQGVRPLTVGDVTIYGITVRTYPFQQWSGSLNVALGVAGGIDIGAANILRSGYIMAQINGTPVKGGTVYIWTAASSAPHVQGGFEVANPGGSGFALPATTTYQGGVDSTGVGEIAYNI